MAFQRCRKKYRSTTVVLFGELYMYIVKTGIVVYAVLKSVERLHRKQNLRCYWAHQTYV